MTVTAINKFGKSSTKSFTVTAPQDQPATIKLVLQECYPYCGEGCGHVSIAYTASFIVTDPDSETVLLTNFLGAPIGNATTNVDPGAANFSYFNSGGQVDPMTLFLPDGGAFTIPACTNP